MSTWHAAVIAGFSFFLSFSSFLQAGTEDKDTKSYQSIEIVASNGTRNMEGSNLMYDSMHFHPDDKVVFTAKIIPMDGAEHAEPPYTYIWYIPGTTALKTSLPTYEWTAQPPIGEQILHLIVSDAKGHVSGSHLKLFLGCFETPQLTIIEGASRPNCQMTLKARVVPNVYSVVKPTKVQRYNWKVEKQGIVLQDSVTNTNTLDITLPAHPGPVTVSMFAVDDNNNHSPEQTLDLVVKPW